MGRISNFRGTYFPHPCNPLSAQQRGEKWCENLKYSLTMITFYSVKKKMHKTNLIQNELTLNSLFE